MKIRACNLAHRQRLINKEFNNANAVAGHASCHVIKRERQRERIRDLQTHRLFIL